MTQLDEIPDVWCRMWTEQSNLAFDLMTDDTRQWSGRTAGLDGVVGARAAADLMTAYRAQRGVRFAPRTVAADASGLLAYTWDAVDNAGERYTGLDFNTVRDGRVIDNWTVSWPRDERADIVGSGTASAGDLGALCRMSAAAHGGVVHRGPAVDVTRQTAAYLWTSADGSPGGVDLIVAVDGRLAQSFSLPVERPFAY